MECKIIIFLLVYSLFIITAGTASGAEIYVNPGESIQSSINGAFPGDTIIVKPGTYYENLEINIDDLTIKSESGNPENTIIRACTSYDDVFDIKASSVIVSGFKITGAGYDAGLCLNDVEDCRIENNEFSNNNWGIYVYSSNCNTLFYNNVSSNKYGIHLDASDNNNLTSNSANSNDGINEVSYDTFFSNGYGISLYNSKGNVLTNNTVNWNSKYGILLAASSNYNTLIDNKALSNDGYYYSGGSSLSVGYGICLETSAGNTLLNNTVSSHPRYGIYLNDAGNNVLLINRANSNRYGVYLENSCSNTLTGNEISFNDYGIRLGDSSGDNLIFLNDLISSYYRNVDYAGTNIWNTTRPLNYTYGNATFTGYLGNHYSDYSGSDYEGDGVGDSPFEERDYYPMMASVDQYRITDVPAVANFNANITSGLAPLAVQFTDSSTGKIYWCFWDSGEASEIESWFWDFGDGNTSTLQNPEHTYSEPDIYTVSLTVTTPHDSDTKTKTGYIWVLEPGAKPVKNIDSKKNFLTIQAAIDDSETLGGHTLIVGPGTYTENIDVTKSLAIISESGTPSDTIVQAGSSSDHVFEVSENSVFINGFNIKGAGGDEQSGIFLNRAENCSIKNNELSENWYGIFLESSSNNTLMNNRANSNSDAGIRLSYSSKNSLVDNTANLNFNDGILLDYSSHNVLDHNTANFSKTYYGILLYYSDYNILNNNVANSNTDGFFIKYSKSNVLSKNIASDNSRYGNFVLYSDYNILNNNIASYNGVYGIFLTRAYNNRIFLNDFIDNSDENVEVDIGSNSWNTPELVNYTYEGNVYTGYLGNHYSDYSGSDSEGDGIGYPSYSVDWDESDQYPLVSSAKQYSNIIKAPPVSDFEANFLSGAFPLTVQFTDLSIGPPASWYWDFGDGFNSKEQNPAHTYNTPGNYTVTLQVSNSAGSNSKTIVDYIKVSVTGGIILVSPGESIQNVINGASPGDTIVVKPGTYHGNFEVNTERLTIMSESGNPEDTIIIASSSFDDIFDIKASHVIIKGLKITGASYDAGLCLNDVGNCSIENNVFSNNNWGVYLYSSTCNRLINNTANSNEYGIYLDKSESDTLANNSASSNQYGVYLYESRNTALSRNTANSNEYGVSLEDSYTNNLDSNKADFNNYGIYLDWSDSNTLTNNSAISNSNYGIYLYFTDYNHIFNNYFNNTENSYIYSSSGNSWNTTKSPGPNIVGGPYLGGNFWATPDGTGWSQIHADSNDDGICEEYYDLGGGNIDYLPLTIPRFVDWDPWSGPDSPGGEAVTTEELQEAIYCWLNEMPAPVTGADINTERLQDVISSWLSN